MKLRGRVVTPGEVIPDGVVEIEGDRIVAVRPAGPDGPDPADDPPPSDDWVLPGLVDLHNHGGGGASLTAADADQVATVAATHLAAGTTSMLGSAVTDAPERLLAVVATLADATDAGLLAGVHVEGPFLAEACCGAQDPAYLLPPDAGLAREIVAAGRGHVRVVTMAAELPGADTVADQLAAYGVGVALGHTAASAGTARGFLAAGRAPLVTHLFNGMPPMHHRSPGPALAALAAAADGATRVELVADGVHLDDETVRAALALVGDRAVLVTDAMAAAGMADGDYDLGPQRVEVRDGVARLAGGGSIAGGTSRLVEQVRRHAAVGIDLPRLVRAAATTPAAVVGLDGPRGVGALRAGLRADVLVAAGSLGAGSLGAGSLGAGSLGAGSLGAGSLAVRRVMRAGEWVGAEVAGA